MICLIASLILTCVAFGGGLIISCIERRNDNGRASFVPVILIVWAVVTLIVLYAGFGSGNIEVIFK